MSKPPVSWPSEVFVPQWPRAWHEEGGQGRGGEGEDGCGLPYDIPAFHSPWIPASGISASRELDRPVVAI